MNVSFDSLTFARPSFLYLLVAVPLLGAMAIAAARWRKRGIARLGRPETIAGLSTVRVGRRRQSRILLLFSLMALALAVAGPRWGKGGETGVVVGRDLVVILDLSRSMTAADMADPVHQQRWQAARAGLHDLVNGIERRGGHRVGLVVFAARPWLVCPLTSDYDHFRARLDEFTPVAPPVEIRPDPEEPLVSGTAIGAAVRMGLAAHDPRFIGHQDMLLLSDGDGPEVEAEVDGGIRDALEKRTPVHVVGLGDPANPTTLVMGEGEKAEFVNTKLQEGTLKEIARRTRGVYLPAQRDVPRLGEWFTQTIEPRASRVLADDAMPQPKDRAVWFVAVAAALALFAWLREV